MKQKQTHIQHFTTAKCRWKCFTQNDFKILMYSTLILILKDLQTKATKLWHQSHNYKILRARTHRESNTIFLKTL